MENLINTFTFDTDVTTVESNTFFCEIDLRDNGTPVWSSAGKWIIKNGKITLNCASEVYDPDMFETVNIEYLQKINFWEALVKLKEVIVIYNDEAAIKDKQIENFLLRIQ